MGLPKVGSLLTLAAVEEELDVALRTLRELSGGQNLMAQAATEYRVGALRRRRSHLQETDEGLAGAAPRGER